MPPHVGSRGKASNLKQNVKNRVHIFMFSCKLLNFINTGAELGQYFCAYTIETQMEDSKGGFVTSVAECRLLDIAH